MIVLERYIKLSKKSGLSVDSIRSMVKDLMKESNIKEANIIEALEIMYSL